MISFWNAFGYTIFCEDFRQDTEGKFMYIGVFPLEMNVNTDFPVALSKFVFAIHYFEDVGVFKESLEFQIVFERQEEDDVIIANIPINLDVKQSPDPTKPLGAVFMPMVLQNFMLPGPGAFRVRAIRDGRTIRLGRLAVTKGNVVASLEMAPLVGK